MEQSYEIDHEELAKAVKMWMEAQGMEVTGDVRLENANDKGNGYDIHPFFLMPVQRYRSSSRVGVRVYGDIQDRRDVIRAKVSDAVPTLIPCKDAEWDSATLPSIAKRAGVSVDQAQRALAYLTSRESDGEPIQVLRSSNHYFRLDKAGLDDVVLSAMTWKGQAPHALRSKVGTQIGLLGRYWTAVPDSCQRLESQDKVVHGKSGWRLAPKPRRKGKGS